jgi:hypothetical protein
VRVGLGVDELRVKRVDAKYDHGHTVHPPAVVKSLLASRSTTEGF